MQSLLQHAVLDTPPEAAFDDLAYLAAELCGTPVALITFVDRDRQWFKARIGAGARECPRNAGFCPLTIEQEGLLLIPDAWADPLLRDRAARAGDLPGRFYAGVPLVTAEGHAIGTLCVLDHVARELQGWQQGALRVLARLAMRELQVRQSRRDLDRRKAEAIGTLAGGLAHELYHLLVALQEQEKLLQARVPPHDPCRAGAQRGLEGARRAAELTRELLGVSRHHSACPQFLDLNELITGLAPEWQSFLGDSVRLRLRLDPKLDPIKADPIQIGRALLCVLESARDEGPRGADLIVATDSVEAESDRRGRYVVVSIGGPGRGEAEVIDRTEAPHAPDLTPAGGPRMGLSAAHGLLAQNGGHLEWTEPRGEGARLRILLPAASSDTA